MRFSLSIKITLLVILVLLGWNHWLPSALDMYNTVSQTDSGALNNVDFFAYYNAGARFQNGQNPYFWGRDPQGSPVVSDFVYPPAVLPVFSLLARLPYASARLMWALLYGLTFLAILAWMARSFTPDWRLPFLALALLLTFVSFPLLSHILHGQVDIFVISLVLACYLAYARGKRLPAAALLAAATLVKVSPVVLLIYFVLFQRDVRFLLMYTLALLLLAGISLLAAPASLYFDYAIHVLPNVGGGSSFWLNQSITKYLAFSPGLARLAGLVGMALLAGAIWAIGRRYEAGQRKPAPALGAAGFLGEAVFILNLAGGLVFLAKAWTATYVWLILPSAWLLTGLAARRASPAALAIAGAGVALTMAKIYGFPVLDSLNLWGGLTLTVFLAAGLLTKRLFPPPSPGPEPR